MFPVNVLQLKPLVSHGACEANFLFRNQFKVDRLQIIVVAKNVYIYVLQLFISGMPKMRAIPQLVLAPLNPIPMRWQGLNPDQ